jgi:RNA polymerase sigma-70 factor (ECF subfamily)
MPLEWTVTRPACADSELVDRLRDGDEGALRDLYVSYGRRLFALALRLTGSADRAEDVVQNSLLAAWRAMRSYRGDGSLLAWLLGIVHNQALNAIRRKALPTVGIGEADAVHAASDQLPDVCLEAREREGAVRCAMGGLTAEHRMVLDLVFYQGLSLAETARVCGCPEGTIKSRLHAAKAKLRRALSAREPEVTR